MSNPADLFEQSSANLRQRLRTAFGNVHERLLASETGMTQLLANQSSVVDGLVGAITNQFSALFTDADQLVTAIRNAEFLWAETETPISFVLEQQATLLLSSGANFPFVPSSVVGLTIPGNTEDYAFAKVIGWSPSTRALSIEVFAVAGAAGPHTGVTVEIAALNTLAVDTIRQAVEAMAAATALDRGAVAEDRAISVAARADAVAARLDSLAAKELAQEWAAKSENDPVSGGLYSALHYAAKAAVSAANAALFDPDSYYTKAQTYTQAEIDAAIDAAIDAVRSGAPGALDTLNELAAALGDDANFATTVTNALAAKAPQATTYTKTDVDGIVAGARSQQTIFTVSGTFTKPTGAKYIFVECWGAGGGGGGGAVRGGGNARFGGSGGGGGAYVSALISVADLASTETVTVGAAGVGGQGAQTTGNNGEAGTDGGVTTFGTFLRANGGSKGAGGAVTTPAAGSGGGAISGPSFGENGSDGTAGSQTTTTNAPNTRKAGAGGAGGSGGTTANVTGNPGNGGAARGLGVQSVGNGAGAAGGVSGTAPTNGAHAADFGSGGGGGGAGVDSNNVRSGAHGGDGGTAAGGGGGGAGTGTGAVGGDGGDGGDGFVRVTSW